MLILVDRNTPAVTVMCMCVHPSVGQVWEAIELAIAHCWRPSVERKAAALKLLYSVADIHRLV